LTPRTDEELDDALAAQRHDIRVEEASNRLIERWADVLDRLGNA
jgi:hypothetical protein